MGASKTTVSPSLLDAVEQVREIVVAGAEQAEAEGTLPSATVAALQRSGLLAMKLPAVLGGAEADLLTQIDTIEALTYVDASTGWCAMVGATAIGWPGAFLPAPAIEEMFAGGRIPTAAVVVQPTGTATKVAGGYRLSGRWAFASGVRHAEWIVAGALMDLPSRVTAKVGLMLVLPRRSVQVLDDWQSMGLQGTGSCAFVIDDLFVPESFAWSFPHARPRRGGPLYRLGWPGFVIHEPAAFALGIGRRVLDELVASQRQRGTVTGTLVPARDTMCRTLGRADLRLRSASALVREVFAAAWDVVRLGNPPSPRLQGEMRGVAAFATDVAIGIATTAFRQAGSAAVYRTGMLQRCLRDIHVAAQHWLARDTAYGLHGQFLLGVPGADPIGDAR